MTGPRFSLAFSLVCCHQKMMTPEQVVCKGSSLGMDRRRSQGPDFKRELRGL